MSGFQISADAAAAYERGPGTFLRPMAERLVAAAAIRPGARVLDVACGTGLVARLAAPLAGPDGEVVGLDLNPAMLAGAHAGGAGGDAPVRWLEASAQDMPLDDGTFDVALCQQGLQFFPEPRAALREILRVLAPGGSLRLNVWSEVADSPYMAAVADAIARFLPPKAHQAFFSAHALADAALLRELLSGAGFAQVRVWRETVEPRLPAVAEFLPVHAAGTQWGKAYGALDETGRALFTDLVAQRLGGLVREGVVCAPFRVLVAESRRPREAA